MNKKQILKEIRKANRLTELVFNFLYKLDVKGLNKTIYRLSEVNEILTNLQLKVEKKETHE